MLIIGHLSRALFAVAVATLFFASSLARASEIAYRVDRVNFALKSDETIGPLKAGTLCLPNGKLQWNELRVPTANEAQSLIIDSMRDAGVSAASVENNSDRTIPLVKLTISAVNMSLCMPGLSMFLGKIKGRVTAHLIWENSAKPLPNEFDIAIEFSKIDPRKSVQILEDVIKEGVGRFLATTPS